MAVPRQAVSVSVADEHLDRFSEVLDQLTKAGLNVEQSLPAIGVVTGSVDSSKLAALKKVKGVSAVEQQQSFQIAPPESPIQ
jgi:hypothetical protein